MKTSIYTKIIYSFIKDLLSSYYVPDILFISMKQLMIRLLLLTNHDDNNKLPQILENFEMYFEAAWNNK